MMDLTIQWMILVLEKECTISIEYYVESLLFFGEEQ